MVKICFIGAGSTIFARNVLGDTMLTPSLQDAEIALYDIDEKRLKESELMLKTINKNSNQNRAKIKSFSDRKEALKDANFVINAIQVGGYKPSTVIDFEIPKKYGLQQTIGDTTGIGGIFRGLRTLPVMFEYRQRHGRGLSGCMVIELHQSDGYFNDGHAESDEDQNGRFVPQCSSLCAGTIRTFGDKRSIQSGGIPMENRRHQPHGLAVGNQPKRKRFLP